MLQTHENQGLFGKGLTLFLTSPCLQYKSFENNVGKREIVFYPFQEFSAIFVRFKIVVCKLSFEELKIDVWERVTHVSRTQKNRLSSSA